MRLLLVVLAVLLCPGWAIVGDSMTYDAKDELEARGAVVVAQGGAYITTGRPALQRFAHDGQDVVVVALGNLDLAAEASPAQLRSRVRAVLQDLATVPCVIWVDLRLLSTVHDDTWAARVAVFNGILEDEVPHVARWSVYSHGHRNWFRADGFHPNRVGQEAYARFLASVVTRSC